MVTAKEDAELVPQVLDAWTVMIPFWPILPDVTVIDVVPDPEVIIHPVGTVHMYVVAYNTPAML
jgi:hypothetical protein